MKFPRRATEPTELHPFTGLGEKFGDTGRGGEREKGRFQSKERQDNRFNIWERYHNVLILYVFVKINSR
jgi:hypothetical protein